MGTYDERGDIQRGCAGWHTLFFVNNLFIINRVLLTRNKGYFYLITIFFLVLPDNDFELSARAPSRSNELELAQFVSHLIRTFLPFLIYIPLLGLSMRRPCRSKNASLLITAGCCTVSIPVAMTSFFISSFTLSM